MSLSVDKSFLVILVFFFGESFESLDWIVFIVQLLYSGNVCVSLSIDKSLLLMRVAIFSFFFPFFFLEFFEVLNG